MDFDAYLDSCRCQVMVPTGPGQLDIRCGVRADHSQAGRYVCNKHLDPRGPRAFATND